MRAIVASRNPAKVGAAAAVLEETFPAIRVEGRETDSGVSAQPLTAEETLNGAINRAKKALQENDADLAVGLEGGVYELQGALYLCNWGALAVPGGPVLTAGGAQIPLPEVVAAAVRAGEELGPVMDRFAEETGIRKHKGAVGVLTEGFITRRSMFEHVVRLLAGQYCFRYPAGCNRPG
ncbi:DUF84 family protein [Indiicoccus explosivorum]|uniref:DUF84 family protein n=1 Tax=Indiicoccus explosivorum TaxID=1917864 RepID=UPI000B4498B0|nr:DUF84 family protein [Indiicoccus explosivorum]